MCSCLIQFVLMFRFDRSAIVKQYPGVPLTKQAVKTI